MSNYRNIAKAKAIEKSNKQRLLKVNPKLDDESGFIEVKENNYGK